MGTPSPMQKPQATRDFERLLRQEIPASEYWESLRREARADVERARRRRRSATA
jgi:hypothetical protein